MAVIVAVPTLGERVYKISSEAVPHLTLLNLGDADLSADAMLYVEHACKELSPFGLSVDYRGELGEDSADVLFFEDNAWDLGRVKEFRHWLLLNDEIKQAYDAADQFEEWTPHLTLGYPEAPAREDDHDHRIGYVDFDRVAVWTGEFEGPEFRLKYDNYAMEVAMSDMTTVQRGEAAVADLFHSGVKGMKWGVRKDEGHVGEQVKTKKLDKLDKQWEKDNTGQRAWMKHYNAAAGKMNDGEIDRINNEPRWKKAADDGILNDLSNPETQAYFKAHEDAFHNAMVESWAKTGSNPSGTKRFEIKEMTDPESGEKYNDVMLVAVKDDVKHAAGDVEPVYRLKRDAQGLITEYIFDEVELKHYGTKGMKWGVRKDEATSRGGASSGPTAVVVAQKKPGTYAKAKGGQGHPIHDDARLALEARQKAKASTTDALSNVELRKAVDRMNLEKQYTQLQFESDRRNRGMRFAAGFLGLSRHNGEKRKFRDSHEQQGEHIRKATDTLSTLLNENVSRLV